MMKRLGGIIDVNAEKIFDLLIHRHLVDCFRDKVETFCRFTEDDDFIEWEIDNWDGVIDTFIEYATQQTNLDKQEIQRIIDNYTDVILDAIEEYFDFYFRYN